MIFQSHDFSLDFSYEQTRCFIDILPHPYVLYSQCTSTLPTHLIEEYPEEIFVNMDLIADKNEYVDRD